MHLQEWNLEDNNGAKYLKQYLFVVAIETIILILWIDGTCIIFPVALNAIAHHYLLIIFQKLRIETTTLCFLALICVQYNSSTYVSHL